MAPTRDNALNGALSRVHAVAGRQVTYDRDGSIITIKRATRGSRRRDVEVLDSIYSTADETDWYVRKVDLGAFHPPERGDRITDPDGVIYEVTGQPNESPYTWVGSTGTNLRIRTKRVSS